MPNNIVYEKQDSPGLSKHMNNVSFSPSPMSIYVPDTDADSYEKRIAEMQKKLEQKEEELKKKNESLAAFHIESYTKKEGKSFETNNQKIDKCIEAVNLLTQDNFTENGESSPPEDEMYCPVSRPNKKACERKQMQLKRLSKSLQLKIEDIHLELKDVKRKYKEVCLQRFYSNRYAYDIKQYTDNRRAYKRRRLSADA